MSLTKDPFRLFFPVGIVLGVVGTLPWIQYIGGTEGVMYPAQIHRQLMIGGFMSSFVSGFLMTAIPRFTSTEFANAWEIIFVFLALLVAGYASMVTASGLYYRAQAIVAFGLIVFATNRFRKRKVNPPGTFLFVGTSIILWLVSCLALSLDPFTFRIFYDFHFQAVLMGLVLGVGGRLIPGILGWTEIVRHQKGQYENRKPFLQAIGPFVAILTFLLWCSYLIEHQYDPHVGRVLRAAVVTTVALRYWKIMKRPKTSGLFQIMIWLSCWCFTLGTWIYALMPEMGAHGLHVIMIGGFSLLTLMVSLRVTLAHAKGLSSKKREKFEKNSTWILWIGGLLLLAMLTRVSFYFFDRPAWSHLGYAAGVWMIAGVLWLFLFTKYQLKLGEKK